MVLINELISAVLQIAIFSLIPFIVFLFRKDKQISFKEYIGFTTPSAFSVKLSVAISLAFLSTAIAMLFMDENMRMIMLEPPSVTGKLRAMGLGSNTVIVLLVIALFKTSLAEEIFFRGFIAKRLMDWLGYFKGNVFQSLIFGILHLVFFFALTKASIGVLAFIFVMSTMGAWFIGLVKVKYANGSIIPGWIAHGLGNTLSYSIVAFII